MATIKTSIQMHNGMTYAFESMEIAYTKIEKNIRAADTAQRQFNDQISNSQSIAEGLFKKIKSATEKFLNVETIKKGIQEIEGWLKLADAQKKAEAELSAIMKERMGVIDIQAVLDITKKQQSIGVIGDEIQLVAAKEIAESLNTQDALQTLIPVMNNLAVWENGVVVTSENMMDIAHRMGEAMKGNTESLSSVGIMFTEAEEKVLKYGDELERADMLAQAVSKHVGDINEAMANTPEGQIQQIKNSFNDIKKTVGNYLEPTVLKFFETIHSNMYQAEAMMMGFADAIIVVLVVLVDIINVASAISAFFIDNWGWIAPIIWGMVAALIAYNATMGIAWLNTIKSVAAKIKNTAISWAETAAIIALTVAQQGLNAALAMCPINWIIIAVIALIAIFYAAVAAVNQFAGTTLSATGLIAGIFTALGAFLYNTFIVYSWNAIAGFVNFFANVFNDPVAAVKVLFYDLAKTVIGYIVNMANAIEKVINKIPGVTIDITSGLDTFYKQLKETSQEAKDASQWIEVAGSLDYIDYEKAYGVGYGLGKGLEGKFSLSNIIGNTDKYSDQLEMMGDLENIAENTGTMRDIMEASEEDLKYLRDLAEGEVIDRTVLRDVKIDFQNTFGDVRETADVDGIINRMTEKVREAIDSEGEGVFNV